MSDRNWTPIFLGDPVPPPVGAYSPAVRAGDFLYVSGQVPRDPRTGALVGDTVEAQTEQVLANLRAVLAAAGAHLSDIVSATIFLADEEDWGAMNAIWKAAFVAPYPARTTVGARLRGILVEINAVAYVPQQR
jgi:2-iminobutanoate/2-iminopropanoate deaminase